MRVLQIINSLDPSGGAEQALSVQAAGLVAAGVDLEVVHFNGRHGLGPVVESAGARVTCLDVGGWQSAIRPLQALVRRSAPDLVHTTLFDADLAGRIAAGRAGVPVVSSLVNVAYGPEHRAAPGIRWSRLRGAQLADIATARVVRRFLAITEHVAQVMCRRLVVPRSRVDVVPRGRDPHLLGAAGGARRERIRSELGLEPHVPVVLAAARHEYQKGLDQLVAAMPVVRSRVPEAVLVVAGREGTQTPLLQELIRTGSSVVCLLGRRHDVPDLLAAADCFVAPSRWEGLGSAVLEAIGVGVPTVATDIPPFREVLGVSGERALLVPPGDPTRLGRAVVETLTDQASTCRRVAAARRRFLEQYTLERAVEGTLRSYERALGSTTQTHRQSAA